MLSQPKSYIKLGLLILGLITIIILSSYFFRGPVKSLASPGLNFSANFVFDFKRESKLAKLVQNVLAGADGKYAVYVENLSDQEHYGLNDKELFPTASLYKLYLLAAVLKEVDSGKLTLKTVVSGKKENLVKRFGAVDFGYDGAPEEITYTIEEALTRIGRISDNFASLMLADKIGWEKLQQVADSLGAKDTIIDDKFVTTAFDTAIFFKKLYLKEVVSPKVSEEVIRFLSLNQLNNRIPNKLPEGTKIIHEQSSGSPVRVIHKTGELPGIRHDAGVVEASPSAYIIVLMSKDLKYEDEGVETLAEISKVVYEYFKVK